MSSFQSVPEKKKQRKGVKRPKIHLQTEKSTITKFDQSSHMDPDIQLQDQPTQQVRTESVRYPLHGLMKSLHYLNTSKSKQIITGLNSCLEFQPYVQIISNNGCGVTLNPEEWKQCVHELSILESFAFIPESELEPYV